jgi:type III secretory pathway component EscT
MLSFARIWIWEYMEITKNTDHISLLSHIYYNKFFLGGGFVFLLQNISQSLHRIMQASQHYCPNNTLANAC